MSISDYEELQALRKLVKLQEEQLKIKDNQIDNLIQALRQSTKKFFGSSSEKSTKIDGQQKLFDNEIELVKALSKEREKLATNNYNPKKKKKSRQPGIRKEMLKQLPTEIIVCDINKEETCPVCDRGLKKIGSHVVRSEVIYEPPKLVVKQYVQNTYKCTDCGTANSDNEKDTFIKATVPKSVLSHSIASPSIVAKIMYDKYGLGLPLYRQEKSFEQLGLTLPRSNMSNWMIRCSNLWLEPIYQRIHEMLLTTKYYIVMKPIFNAIKNLIEKRIANHICGYFVQVNMK